ncbi:thioesterase family protein-like protein [Periconia macrospinosa]|uniref:Thioesterase family protein-like protein n=1 Tax=Periconia macrospinosa TaxID=97972 RepID=A0A2V1ECD8_9PLEO|nr:thioesterase family protein-like protein [Periconia macrospinosa]
MADKKAMDAVEAMFERYRLLAAQRPIHHIDFDRHVMQSLRLVEATMDGSVTFDLFMSSSFSNLNDVMHGGAAGVIFDMATTAALCPLARPGYWEFMGGVTRSLNISYLKAVPIGTQVRLSSQVVSVGKQMALIRGVMTTLDGSITYATADHHKVNAPVRASHRQARLPWDDQFDRNWKTRSRI